MSYIKLALEVMYVQVIVAAFCRSQKAAHCALNSLNRQKALEQVPELQKKEMATV